MTSKYKISLYEITITAILTALLMLLRYVTASITGVTFTTGIVIFVAAFLSLRVAALAGCCLYLITGAYYGFGLWIPLQMLGVVLIAVIVYFLPKTRFALTVYGFLSAFLYSFVMLFSALPFMPLSGIPAYVVAGLPNDLIHALVTSATILVLYQKNLIRLMTGYRDTYLHKA